MSPCCLSISLRSIGQHGRKIAPNMLAFILKTTLTEFSPTVGFHTAGKFELNKENDTHRESKCIPLMLTVRFSCVAVSH